MPFYGQRGKPRVKRRQIHFAQLTLTQVYERPQEKKKQQCLCTFIQLMPFALTWHLLVLHHLMAAAENCISNGLYFIFSTWFLDSSKSQYCRLWPPPCCEMSSSSFTPWRHQHLDFFFFFFFFANIALTIYIYLSTVHCSHVPSDH